MNNLLCPDLSDQSKNEPANPVFALFLEDKFLYVFDSLGDSGMMSSRTQCRGSKFRYGKHRPGLFTLSSEAMDIAI
jgi:hypothetical protein